MGAAAGLAVGNASAACQRERSETMTAQDKRPYADALAQLKAVGLRPTRQRLALAKLLLEKGDHHTTAEQLHAAARANDISVSLATVYNTLHQFKECGLVREVVVETGRSYFDTNTRPHHHFFHEARGELVDIPAESVSVDLLPDPPEGTEINQVDVVIRVGDRR